MSNKDARVDEYIHKAADFAKPILMQIRDTVHKASPEITESIKWGMPAFEYKGFLCGMAAFKKHCAFNFWKGTLLKDPNNIMNPTGESAMGNLGKIVTVKDLPKEKHFLELIKQAMKLNEEGITVPKKKSPAETTEIEIPEDFASLLKKNKTAQTTFDNFSRSHRKEYVEWITEAKTEATREKRMATSIEWLSEGKSRMWKYEKK